ncbi:MAG: hypothetical protein WC547_09685 [Candidatus Omnitrophota bacterium]
MTEKLKKIFACSPLACLSVFMVIVGILFGSVKKDISEFRQEIRADLAQVNSLIITNMRNAALPVLHKIGG